MHTSFSAGLDFQSTQTMVPFPSGVTTAHVQVPIIDDSTFEETKMFSASMSTTNNNVRFGADTALVTILDNDREFLQWINLEFFQRNVRTHASSMAYLSA